MELRLSALALLALVGCAKDKPTFFDMGDNTAVSAASVAAYAREHNVSEGDALKRMLAEREAERAAMTEKSGPPRNDDVNPRREPAHP
jgi:hypothetical protein